MDNLPAQLLSHNNILVRELPVQIQAVSSKRSHYQPLFSPQIGFEATVFIENIRQKVLITHMDKEITTGQKAKVRK